MHGISTRKSIAAGLRDLGVSGAVLVHTRMSALGYVVGGARTVVEALAEVCDTVMMPAFSGDMSDPSEWQHPSAGDVAEDIPPFDLALTPTRGCGMVAEYFRTYPGVRRSSHPQSSFCVLGTDDWLAAQQPMNYRFGEYSPLDLLSEIAGHTLLLGAPRNTATALYLTEHYPSTPQSHLRWAPVAGKGWIGYSDIDYPADWLADGVDELVRAGIAKEGIVSGAPSVLFPVAPAIEHLVEWRQGNGRAVLHEGQGRDDRDHDRPEQRRASGGDRRASAHP